MRDRTGSEASETPAVRTFTAEALRAMIPAGYLDVPDDIDALPEADPGGTTLIPFLKWPGGKRWLVTFYSDLIPRTFNRYVEPFLGGGSVYFHLQPERALLGDINIDVVRVFRGVKLAPHRIGKLLEQHHTSHSEEYYYAMRDAVPKTLAEQAARMIYLNRTCFNGIYRVNRGGRFNVPLGTRKNVVFETDNFAAASRLLRTSEIQHRDFEVLIDAAQEGDLVFADPPYTVRHNTNGFVLYNETLFSWSDQIRLAQALYRARERGVRVLSTNAAHESVRELYEQRGFTLRNISRFSPIAAHSKSRKQFDELVITA
jgi:DNA adenine methylase